MTTPAHQWTDEELQIAIAKWMGWTKVRLAILGAGGGTRVPTAHGYAPGKNYESDCPNYPYSLDAVALVEAKLKKESGGRSVRNHYRSYLCQLMSDMSPNEKLWDNGTFFGNVFHGLKCIDATARQRCVGIATVLGLERPK